MSPSEEELKARMMAEAEGAIEELLARAGAMEDIVLSDIERLVRAAGQQVQQGLTETLVQAKREEENEGGVLCPECGQKMRYKGQKRKWVITETGEVTLERAHYYCETCRKGVFPPGRTLGIE